MPALTHGPDIPLVISYQEKCNTLQDILYQEPPNLPDLIVADFTQRSPDEIPFIEITPTKVSEALFSTSSNTALELSQITYKMIRWVWPIAAELITMLFQRYLSKGYHSIQ